MARPKVAHITLRTHPHIICWPEHLTGSQPTTRKLRNVISRTQEEDQKKAGERKHKSKQHHLSTVSPFSDCDPASRAERQTPYLNLLWRDFLNKTCLGFKKFLYCSFRK